MKPSYDIYILSLISAFFKLQFITFINILFRRIFKTTFQRSKKKQAGMRNVADEIYLIGPHLQRSLQSTNQPLNLPTSYRLIQLIYQPKQLLLYFISTM